MREEGHRSLYLGTGARIRRSDRVSVLVSVARSVVVAVQVRQGNAMRFKCKVQNKDQSSDMMSFASKDCQTEAGMRRAGMRLATTGLGDRRRKRHEQRGGNADRWCQHQIE